MTPDRLGEVLDATYECLARYGVKRTTMDDIAGSAGMSRAAVYQYVRSKDDAVRRVAIRLHERALDRARAAASDPSPTALRICGVLEAKLGLVVELAGNSPHTAELLDSKARLFGDICHQFTDDIGLLLESVFVESGITSMPPAEAAEICVALVVGLEGRPEAAHLLPSATSALVGGLLRSAG